MKVKVKFFACFLPFPKSSAGHRIKCPHWMPTRGSACQFPAFHDGNPAAAAQFIIVDVALNNLPKGKRNLIKEILSVFF